MPPSLQHRVLSYIRRQSLLRAGDRVGIAVSGGADSTALFRLLLELRSELGIVPAVVHFNHKIRGAEADADEQFVQALAERNGIEFHSERGDTLAFCAEKKLSLETGARALRYAWFTRLLTSGQFEKIATAHTLDDQAETVLLKLLRGAGTRGMAGIHPVLRTPVSDTPNDSQARSEQTAIVRPLLEITRSELEAYLRSLGQDWCEDRTNLDPKHSRNRVRHLLLPVIEREFNPAVKRVLADSAEIARAEEEYWRTIVETCGADVRLTPEALAQMPLAFKRRAVRAAAERHGLRLDFQQVEGVIALATAQTGARLELSKSWVAERERDSVIFRPSGGQVAKEYEYTLTIPGEVRITELGILLRASVVCPNVANAGYNPEQLLSTLPAGHTLQVRNWRPGDRFWPAHAKSARKVKELLQERHITGPERALWPVLVNAAGELLWMRGFPVAEQYAARANDSLAVQIVAVNLADASTGTPEAP